jgi:hypothetical protein
MSAPSSPTRSDVLTATAAVAAASLLPTALRAETMDDRIRPFRVGDRRAARRSPAHRRHAMAQPGTVSDNV